MRLLDLKPKWYELPDGIRVGFSFDCPHCQKLRLSIGLHEAMHDMIIDAEPDTHPPKEHFIWKIVSGSDFNDLTVTPSLDASAWECWHGFIANGEIR
jgi:hypothetical protein